MCRKYGYSDADNEARAEPSDNLNKDSVLQNTEIRKHTAKKGRDFRIPCGIPLHEHPAHFLLVDAPDLKAWED